MIRTSAPGALRGGYILHLVLALLLGIMLSAAAAQTAQPPEDTYKITEHLSIRRIGFGRMPPVAALTSDDLTILIDKKVSVPVICSPDPSGKRNAYILTFSPPPAYRDGRKHRVDLTIRQRTTLKKNIVFPKPPSGELTRALWPTVDASL